MDLPSNSFCLKYSWRGTKRKMKVVRAHALKRDFLNHRLDPILVKRA